MSSVIQRWDTATVGEGTLGTAMAIESTSVSLVWWGYSEQHALDVLGAGPARDCGVDVFLAAQIVRVAIDHDHLCGGTGLNDPEVEAGHLGAGNGCHPEHLTRGHVE